jgi:hypothetical protein
MQKINRKSVLDLLLTGLGINPSPRWESTLRSDATPLSFESMLALKMRLKRKHRINASHRLQKI